MSGLAAPTDEPATPVRRKAPRTPLRRRSLEAVQGSLPGATGEKLHYLRFVPVFHEESLVGCSRRLPSNRHNPYFAPGSLAAIGREGLAASDCRKTSNPQTVPVYGTGAPPCRVQPPWEFKGVSRYFPHVERAYP